MNEFFAVFPFEGFFPSYLKMVLHNVEESELSASLRAVDFFHFEFIFLIIKKRLFYLFMPPFFPLLFKVLHCLDAFFVLLAVPAVM